MELQELSAVKQAVMRAYAGAVNGMNSNQGPVFGCVVTEFSCAEFFLDVPPSHSQQELEGRLDICQSQSL